MPANVDSMFSVRRMPWHREGEILRDWPGSWAEARKHAGLLWEPVEAPVYVRTSFIPDPMAAEAPQFLTFTADAVSADGNPEGISAYEKMDSWKAVLHSETREVLSITSDSRAIIGHEDMGAIIEAVLDQPGVKWETAGSLNGGRQVWCLAYLDEPVTIKGDSSVTLPYLAMTNHHDSGGCPLRATAVRIVCANTFSAAEAEGERTGAVFTFRHTKNWRDRIEEARQAVTGARKEIAAYTELAEHLMGITVTDKQRESFVQQFIPMPPETMITDRVARNVEEARAAVRGILDSVTTEAVSHTAYGLVQAGGEYLDHVRAARSWESRLGRTIIRPEPGKARIVKLVKELVEA